MHCQWRSEIGMTKLYSTAPRDYRVEWRPDWIKKIPQKCKTEKWKTPTGESRNCRAGRGLFYTQRQVVLVAVIVADHWLRCAQRFEAGPVDQHVGAVGHVAETHKSYEQGDGNAREH